MMGLKRNQWLKPADLQKIQQKRLRAILKYSYDNVEFYHRRFEAAGIRPEDIKTFEDLPKIPVTKRSDIRDGVRARTILTKNTDLSKCTLSHTTGTSGEPLTIVFDEKAEDFQKAVAVRSFLESGGSFRDKWAMITIPYRMRMKKKWFQGLGFLSPIYLSVFDSVEHNASVLKSLKPDVIEGYTTYIWLLAKAIREKRAEYFRPRIVITTAELLTKDARDFINETFGLELFDQFGGAEIGRSAWECQEHVGYHMDVDALAMEFVKGNEHVAPGERGRLLYTSLYNYAMPLIRYDVGDVCVPMAELCPCGRGLPLLKIIEGRMDDLLTSSTGELVSPTLLLILMKETPGIAAFRILQETKTKLRVQIVKDENFSNKTPLEIRKGIQRILGEDVEVEINEVEEMPKDKSGKLRAITSKVPVDL